MQSFGESQETRHTGLPVFNNYHRIHAVMARDDHLFATGDLAEALRAQTQRVAEVVNQIPQDKFLASTDQQLVENVVSNLEVEPLVLHEDHAEMDQQEAELDVSGDPNRDWGFRGRSGPLMVPATRVTITIPFTGDKTLWELRPSSWYPTSPIAQIIQRKEDPPGALVITITKSHDAPQDEFKNDCDLVLKDIRLYLDNQKTDVDQFNTALPGKIQDAITARRKRIGKHEGLSEILDIPLKRKAGAPPIQPIKVEKKIIRPLPAPKPGLKPEPGIDQELYDNILTIIRHEGRTYETTPATFSKLDEEELRDVILAHLNGHFEGGATGETFRKHGKTDIRIEDNDRAAFIGECKLWRGPKELLAAVDQLLGYLTWRDCKASLIIFNKNIKGFTKLLETVPESLTQHRLFEKDLGQQDEGEWRHIFRSSEDEERHITIHTYLFNIYIEK